MMADWGMKSKFPRDVEYWTERGWLDEKTRFFYDTEMSVPLKMYGFAVRALAGVLNAYPRTQLTEISILYEIRGIKICPTRK
jgi:hypothetical protein